MLRGTNWYKRKVIHPAQDSDFNWQYNLSFLNLFQCFWLCKKAYSGDPTVLWCTEAQAERWLLGSITTEQLNKLRQKANLRNKQPTRDKTYLLLVYLLVPCPSVCMSTCLTVRQWVRSLTTILCLSFCSCSDCWSTNLAGLIPPIRVQITYLSVWLSDCLRYQSQTAGLNLKLQTLCTDVKHGHLPTFSFNVTLIWNTQRHILSILRITI